MDMLNADANMGNPSTLTAEPGTQSGSSSNPAPEGRIVELGSGNPFPSVVEDDQVTEPEEVVGPEGPEAPEEPVEDDPKDTPYHLNERFQEIISQRNEEREARIRAEARLEAAQAYMERMQQVPGREQREEAPPSFQDLYPSNEALADALAENPMAVFNAYQQSLKAEQAALLGQMDAKLSEKEQALKAEMAENERLDAAWDQIQEYASQPGNEKYFELWENGTLPQMMAQSNGFYPTAPAAFEAWKAKNAVTAPRPSEKAAKNLEAKKAAQTLRTGPAPSGPMQTGGKDPRLNLGDGGDPIALLTALSDERETSNRRL